LVSLFGETFNKSEITSKVDLYLKYQYRVHLKETPKYDHSLVIPKRVWKDIQDDTKEIALRQEGKTLPGRVNYIIF